MARALLLQAEFWDGQYKFEEAKSEALRALDGFEKLGVADEVEGVRQFLRQIDRDACEPDDNSELFEKVLLVLFIDSSCSDGIAESE